MVSIIRVDRSADSSRGRAEGPPRSPSVAPCDAVGDARPVDRGRLPQRRKDRGRGVGDVAGEGDGDGTEAVDQIVEDAIELVCPGLVLRQLPRRARLDLAVEGPHDLPDALQRPGDVEVVQPFGDIGGERGERRGDAPFRGRTARSVPPR